MNIPKHEPTQNYLLLEIDPPSDVSPGGIIIPEQAKNNSHEGRVLKVGPEVRGPVSIGDLVVYTEHSAYKLNIDGYPVVLVAESNIILRLPRGYTAETEAPQTA